jgi:hypothetical protein
MSFCDNCFVGEDAPGLHHPHSVLITSTAQLLRTREYPKVRRPFLPRGRVFNPDGIPGKIQKIGGIESYVATPSIPHPKERVLIFLTDIFGLSLVNNRVRNPHGLVCLVGG